MCSQSLARGISTEKFFLPVCGVDWGPGSASCLSPPWTLSHGKWLSVLGPVPCFCLDFLSRALISLRIGTPRDWGPTEPPPAPPAGDWGLFICWLNSQRLLKTQFLKRVLSVFLPHALPAGRTPVTATEAPDLAAGLGDLLAVSICRLLHSA